MIPRLDFAVECWAAEPEGGKDLVKNTQIAESRRAKTIAELANTLGHVKYHLKLADPLSADVRQIQRSKLRFGYDGAFNVLS